MKASSPKEAEEGPLKDDSLKKVNARSTWILILAVMLLSFLVLDLQYTESTQSMTQYFIGLMPSTLVTSSPSLSADKSIESLIISIREATDLVRKKTGMEFPFTNSERNLWLQDNPCRSRRELMPLYEKLGRACLQNAEWDTVLREYSTMHRTCLQAAGNLSEYLLSRNDTTGCKFYVTHAMNGLGNKILYFTSSLLYAVLTQRVLLIPASTSVPDVLCEPFEGSSWKLPADIHWQGQWNESNEFFHNVDLDRAGDASASIYAARVDDNWHPRSRFYCHVEQEYFSRVTWLSSGGCLYYLPKLFAIPSFRPILEALFVDPSLTLTQMLRSVMLPDDNVWGRTRAVYSAYLDKSDIQVGMQVRFFKWHPYDTTNAILNSNVVQCSTQNGFLPNISSSLTAPVISTNSKIIKVFIASLYPGLKEHLTNIYLKSFTVSGDSVGVFQLTHAFEQRRSLDEDQQALVEIMLLSFSQTLLVSGTSTFGGLAQAYGGVIPWFISFDSLNNTEPPCTQAQTLDICYQGAQTIYTCPHNPEVNGKPISEVVPYIRTCLKVDASGVQLTKPNITKVL